MDNKKWKNRVSELYNEDYTKERDNPGYLIPILLEPNVVKAVMIN